MVQAEPEATEIWNLCPAQGARDGDEMADYSFRSIKKVYGPDDYQSFSTCIPL